MPFIPLHNIAQVQNNKDVPKIGIVINTSDPTGDQRVKVKLDGMFDPIDDIGSNLPWVRQMNDTFMNGKGREAYSVPPVGSPVEIIWPYDNTTPYYRGCPSGGGNKSQGGSGTAIFTSPSQWGWSDGVITLIMDSGVITITNGSDTIIMNGSGVSISGANINITGTTTITGDCTIAGGNVTISGGNCVIDDKNFLNHTHTCAAEGSPSGPVD